MIPTSAAETGRSNWSGPPRTASALLSFCLPEPQREAVVGDLAEVYADAIGPSRDPSRANRWYWGQVVRSIWPALTLHVDRRGLGRLLGAVFVGFATMWIVGDVILVSSRAGYAALFPSAETSIEALRATYLISMIPTSLFAGYLAARSGGTVGRLAAVTLGLMLILPVLIAPFASHGGDPLWARAAWVISAPLATLRGAAFHTRSSGEA